MKLPSDELRLITEPEELLLHILKIGVSETGADYGSLMLLNPNTDALDIEVSIGLGNFARGTRLKLGEGVTGWVASMGKPARVDDVTRDRRYVAVDARVRSELAVPLLLNDQVVGVLNVDSVKPSAFSRRHERKLTALANQAADWIKLAWDINQLKVKGSQLETLVDMGQIIVSQSDLNNVLQRIAEQSARLMNLNMSSIMLLSEDGKELSIRAWHGASEAYISRPNLSVADSLVGVVVKRKKPITVLNVQRHVQFQQTELARREGLVSLLSVPLVFQKKALGVLSVYTKRLHRFSNEEIRLLTAMAGLSAVAIAKAQLFERIVLAEENMKAAERLSALGWLAAEVAHEIRNPLAVIQMLFHSLVNDLQPQGDAARDAELIDDKLKQMNRILDQVLTFSKSAEPEMVTLDVKHILEDLVVLLRLKMREENIELHRNWDEEEELIIRGDRNQLEQAILNLVLNGSQAMPDGGILQLSASRRAESAKAYVVIGIRDSGKGMAAHEVEEIFEPFVTGRVGGSGIGLVLVKRTVEEHGGKIRVESTPGVGTLVEMLLPQHADVSG